MSRYIIRKTPVQNIHVQQKETNKDSLLISLPGAVKKVKKQSIPSTSKADFQINHRRCSGST